MADRALSLIEELKRRRVFRAVVGYGIAAFAVLQIIEPIMHGLHWPDQVLSYVVVGLGAGFPVVVSLAWIFDVSAGRIERTGPAPGSGGVRLAAILVGIGLLAATPGVAWYFVLRPAVRTPSTSEAPRAAAVAAAPPAPAQARAAPSVAVLPFSDLSPNRDQEYFADGITEELINALSNVPGLKVASRTSVYALKARNLDAREIGARLNVATLLEGTVRRKGGALRVTAQLVHVADDAHLWSKSFDRKVKGVFALEDEIARSIAHTLQGKLLPGGAPSTVKVPTASTEAHDLFLQGRYFASKRTGEGLRTAAALYTRAVELDPAYALGWVGIAEAHSLRHQYDANPVGLLPKARESALRALALDPTLPEANAILGLVELYGFRWADAERALRRAIELSPRYPTAHHWLACALQWSGQVQQARAEADRAYELDPGSPIIANEAALIRVYQGDLAGALEAFKRPFEIVPTFGISHWYRGDLHALLGRQAEAEADYAAAWPLALAERGRGVMHALAGRREEARLVAERMEERARTSYSSPAARGLVWLALGEKDRGFGLLLQACKELDATLLDVKAAPQFAPLRADPRFAEVLRCMHLE